MSAISRSSHWSITCWFLIIPTIASCANAFNLDYEVIAGNSGKQGVILLTPPFTAFTRGTIKNRDELEGSNPRKNIYLDPTQPTYVGQFSGHKDRLSDEKIEIAWQAAELTECQRADVLGPNLIHKSGCTWKPLPNKIYQKVLDLGALKTTREYQRTGKAVDGNLLYGTYTLNIYLVFDGDELEIELENGQTPGFMQ